MSLPFQPEAEASMRARYAAALEGVYTAEGCADESRTPGKRRRHVFDFDRGLRLIVSVDDFGHGPMLHVSASVRAGSPLEAHVSWMTDGRERVAHVARECLERLASIGGTLPTFRAVTGGGVLHFFDCPATRPGRPHEVN